MGQFSMSALHLISGIINVPRFHRELTHCPKELTERCVHLLTNLGQNRDFAIKANYEMMEFLTRCILPFDDAGYMRVSRHFVKELLSIVGPQHKMWGAISFVMLSTPKSVTDDKQYLVWHRLNARFFEVLLDSGVISQEDERRLKAKRDSAQAQSSLNALNAQNIKPETAPPIAMSHTDVAMEDHQTESLNSEKSHLDQKSEQSTHTSKIEGAKQADEQSANEQSTDELPTIGHLEDETKEQPIEDTPQIIGRSVKVQVRSAFTNSSFKS
jgi:hypothetical protein